jgi:hypothetical protein
VQEPHGEYRLYQDRCLARARCSNVGRTAPRRGAPLMAADARHEPLPPDREAIDCRFLRRTIVSGRLDGPVVALCEHPVRDGFECVGPFIEDLPTACRLWERRDR